MGIFPESFFSKRYFRLFFFLMKLFLITMACFQLFSPFTLKWEGIDIDKWSQSNKQSCDSILRRHQVIEMRCLFSICRNYL